MAERLTTSCAPTAILEKTEPSAERWWAVEFALLSCLKRAQKGSGVETSPGGVACATSGLYDNGSTWHASPVRRIATIPSGYSVTCTVAMSEPAHVLLTHCGHQRPHCGGRCQPTCKSVFGRRRWNGSELGKPARRTSVSGSEVPFRGGLVSSAIAFVCELS